MKTFIYICLYICLLVIGLVLPAGAQVPIQSYRGQVSVKQNRIEREGNSLRLDLTSVSADSPWDDIKPCP